MTFTKTMISKLRMGCVAVALAALVPAMALAEQHDDTARLVTTIDTFETNFQSGNYESMMNNLPPRLIDAVVAQTGQDRGSALSALGTQTRNAMEGIEVILIEMDVENSTITEATGDLSYALIPTVTVLRMADGQRIRTTTTTLGLEEDGIWTLSRIASPQQEAAMKSLYPEISDVRFPDMTQKVLN